MPQSPTFVPTVICPSTFHREFENNYLKCHNHRRLYRQNNVRRHFTESSKIITWNATITDVYTDGYKSIGKLPTKLPTDCTNSKGLCIKCFSDCVILPTDHENYGGSLKILVRNSKITDGFLTLHRQNKLK